MRCHRIEVAGRVRFAPSTTEAVHLRGLLCKEGRVAKVPEQMQVVEIPTDKPGLIEYLNGIFIERENSPA